MIIAGEINNLDDWFTKAGPMKGAVQWKDGYSAKEFAKKVLSQDFEDDIKQNILNKIGDDFVINFAIPEYKTYIDSFGEPRHHDLVLFCENKTEKIALCFEAKVAEDFDTVLSKKWDNGNDPNSKYHDRINGILKALCLPDYAEASMKNIRYQLLTGTMGALKLAEEKNIRKVVFCAYQLCGEDSIVKRHEDEINDYLKLLKIDAKITNNALVCPIKNSLNKELYFSYLKRSI